MSLFSELHGISNFLRNPHQCQCSYPWATWGLRESKLSWPIKYYLVVMLNITEYDWTNTQMFRRLYSPHQQDCCCCWRKWKRKGIPLGRSCRSKERYWLSWMQILKKLRVAFWRLKWQLPWLHCNSKLIEILLDSSIMYWSFLWLYFLDDEKAPGCLSHCIFVEYLQWQNF